MTPADRLKIEFKRNRTHAGLTSDGMAEAIGVIIEGLEKRLSALEASKCRGQTE